MKDLERQPVKLLFAVQNTKWNDEDFALTPFIFTPFSRTHDVTFIGIGLCWGHYAGAVCLAFNVPKKFPMFRVADYGRRKKESEKQK